MYDKHCRNVSPEEVEKKLAEGLSKVVRLKVPEHETIIAHDEIRGDISFDTNLIDDQVLVKADGFPTYHLAVVVDDHLMEITHIVRGEEWIPSFPKHVLIYRYLDWQMGKFYHTAALRNPDKSKLSKRQGHTNVSWYKEEGYLPEAILNYIALLGWSHPEEKEIFSLEEFVQLFDLKDIKPIGPVFDINKLLWMNGEYIRMMSNDALQKALVNFFTSQHDQIMIAYLNDNKHILDEIITLAKTRMKTLKEFRDLVLPLEVQYTEEEKHMANIFTEKLTAIEDWNSEAILAVMREMFQEQKIKGKVLYKIITGRETGLPLPEFLATVGKEKTLERLQI
jgi:nondiscriminating glutamyl-tRNA synthetase